MFAATLNVAVPLPLPLAPDVIVIHDALLCAVHAQPPAADTDIGPPAPPPNGNEEDCAFTLYVHAGVVGGCGGGVGGAGDPGGAGGAGGPGDGEGGDGASPAD